MTEVAVSEYRADMKAWHERVRRGEQVLITERGRPSVRLVPVDDVEDIIEGLIRKGLMRPATQPRRVLGPPIGKPGDITRNTESWR